MPEERTRPRRSGGERRPRRRGAAPRNRESNGEKTQSTETSAADASEQAGDESTLDLNSLYKMDSKALSEAAKALDISSSTSMRKQELIFEIMKAQSELSGLVFA